VLRLLTEHGADLHCKTNTGNTTLHFAAQYDRSEVVTFLLRQEETDKDLANTAGHTAVHVAARYGKENVVKILIEQKANVLLSDKIGRSPEQLATEFGHNVVADLLKEEATQQMLAFTIIVVHLVTFRTWNHSHLDASCLCAELHR